MNLCRNVNRTSTYPGGDEGEAGGSSLGSDQRTTPFSSRSWSTWLSFMPSRVTCHACHEPWPGTDTGAPGCRVRTEARSSGCGFVLNVQVSPQGGLNQPQEPSSRPGGAIAPWLTSRAATMAALSNTFSVRGRPQKYFLVFKYFTGCRQIFMCICAACICLVRVVCCSQPCVEL